MTLPDLKLGDVIVLDGLWYMPHHPPIIWRGLDPATHCLTVHHPAGFVLSPEFTGIKPRQLSEYAGRRATIHRYKEPLEYQRLRAWLGATFNASHGYDFRQWLVGFVLGITRREWVDASRQWTCAELPYWLFQDNGYELTPKPEVLPMPRLFRYSPLFDTIFAGELPCR